MNPQSITEFIKTLYPEREFIPLHAPVFYGREKEYLAECIDTTFVSSVGKFVDRFEEMITQITGAKRSVAVVNGTNGIHLALRLLGVKPDEEVLTQALTFIATCNAISYTGAKPVFIDVDKETMGMSASILLKFLKENCERNGDLLVNRKTGRRIAACVPMHTFGYPCEIDKIASICSEFGIPLVEDAAESLGSFIGETHTGLTGDIGVISFNGNKTVTTGGGGVLVFKDEDLAIRAKHLSTTAKLPHPWEFNHDEIGFNYRMPNINAALGCAQLEKLDDYLQSKSEIHQKYKDFFSDCVYALYSQRESTKANHWLNTLICPNQASRDELLQYTNEHGVMTRPVWTLMSDLPMFEHCQHSDLVDSRYLADRIVNLPSGVP